MLPELYTVNKAATWNESYRSYLGRSHRRKVGIEIRSKACCEKSAEVIVPFFTGRTEQIPVLINWRKESNTMKAEYRKGCLQMDSVEREWYAGVPSVGTRDNRERDNANQALWYLNRRVPNGTHGGVRGRLLK